ncbi:hypothetical protein ABTA99_19765, partial [Acinetobacter baumannii]
QNPALKGRFKSPYAGTPGTHITPLVWKRLVLTAGGHDDLMTGALTPPIVRANTAARRLVQGFLEYKAGRRMRALDLVGDD